MARRNWSLLLGALLTGLMITTTLVGLVFTPHPPNAMEISNRLQPPSAENLLGTDNFGRDVFSRLMIGGRAAFVVGLAAVGAGFVVGTIWGAVAGFYRGWAEEVLMRLADGLYSFPALLVALLAITLLGPGLPGIVLAVAIANMPVFARLTRGVFLSLARREFITAARSLGASDWRILFRHLLPNCLATLVIQASISFAAAVLAEASLSYLGLGIQPPDASWGRMLREAQAFADIAPWTAIFPGIAIALTVLGFNQLGEGLRNALDPRY